MASLGFSIGGAAVGIPDGTVMIDNSTINSGDPDSGGVYVYNKAAGGYVSSRTGQLSAPTTPLIQPPDGYHLTNSDGSVVTYSAKTGGFTSATGAPVNPSTINGGVAPYAQDTSYLGIKQAGTDVVNLDKTVLGDIKDAAGDIIPVPSLGSIDTGAISKDAAASGATGASLLSQGANYVGGTAQQLTPAQAQASLAAQGAPIQAGQAQAAIAATGAPIQAGQAQASLAAQGAPIAAATYAGANIGPAALAQQQAAIQAQQVKAAQAQGVSLAPTALAGTTQIAPASLASQTTLSPAAQAQAAQLDLANANQTRAQQEGLVGSLQGTIAGTTPSVAAMMLRNATDNNVANQYALAQAANGMNAGQAGRTAMIDSAQLNQQEIYQQALLRAGEVQSAQQQLGTNLGTLGSQDLGTATTQAGLQQQTALSNQSATNSASQAQLSADVQTKLANAGFVNTQAMNQAQLNQAIALANAGFKNTATTTQAQLDAATQQLNVQQQNAVAQGNQSASLAAGTTNATLANQVALANAASQNSQSQAQGSLSNAAGIASANNVTGANTETAQLANQVALANAAAQSAASTANANNTTSANTTSAQLANQVALANAAAQTGASTTNANNTTSANTTSAQLASQVALANANNATGVSTTNAAQANSVGQANQTAALNQQTINNTASNNLTSAGVTSQGQAITGDVGAANAQAQAQMAQAAMYGAIATGATGLLTKSDRRAKTDIADGSSDVSDFMDSLAPYKYRYKDGSKPGEAPGRRWGIMAQDLERSTVGRSLVRDTPDGKVVDVSQAAMAALAGLAALNKRLDRG